MPLTKCPRSGKLFDNTKGPVHPDCMAEEEADYEKVLDSLAGKPRSTPKEISDATGVDIECIDRMIHQGALEEFDLGLEKAREEEYLEEERRRVKREVERKAKLMQDLASVKKPPPKTSSAESVRSLVNQKRRS